MAERITEAKLAELVRLIDAVLDSLPPVRRQALLNELESMSWRHERQAAASSDRR